jgi:HK97 family phage major capsid protein
MGEITREFPSERLDEQTQSEWDAIRDEKKRLEADIADVEERQAIVAQFADDDRHVEKTYEPTVRNIGRKQLVPSDPHDISEYRNLASGLDDLARGYKEGAKRIVENMTFAHPEANREDQQEHVERLIDTIDGRDGEFSKRVIVTGGDTYKRAFGKWMAGEGLTPEEQRTLSLTTTAGGYAVPVTLDPTVILTSNGVVNPIRQLARTVTITGNVWEGVTSTGITAGYSAEATETTDNAPALAQPVANVEKAQAFVPFSIEIGEDWGAIQSEMAMMFQDAKDTLEADKFMTGLGHASHVPQGLLVGATAVVTSAATATFAVADVYSLEAALAPRWRPNASFVGNRAIYNKVRQFDTAGGANMWVQLQDSAPPRLIGYPAYEYSNFSSSVTTSAASVLTLGDFSRGFLIVDRVGMNVELVPHLFGTVANYPSGQRGLYCYWRNTSIVIDQLMFKTLKLL